MATFVLICWGIETFCFISSVATIFSARDGWIEISGSPEFEKFPSKSAVSLVCGLVFLNVAFASLRDSKLIDVNVTLTLGMSLVAFSMIFLQKYNFGARLNWRGQPVTVPEEGTPHPWSMLEGATYNENTIFPEGFDPVQAGMRLVPSQTTTRTVLPRGRGRGMISAHHEHNPLFNPNLNNAASDEEKSLACDDLQTQAPVKSIWHKLKDNSEF